MRASWDDVNARARGLGTHLLARRELELLTEAAHLDELASRLQRAGFGEAAPARATAASSLERAVRRVAAARLALLARWCGERTARLAVVFEDEDRRSLRALLRGALAGAAAERRLSGLLPTPSLPERALEELARLRTPAEIVAVLSLWRNPYAEALRPEAERVQPDPFRLEAALSRLFVARATRAARRESLELRHFVKEAIDLENVATALLLAPESTEMEPEEAFLPGGRFISQKVFLEAARAGAAAAAAGILGHALAATPFAEPLALDDGAPTRVERVFLQVRLRQWMKAARGHPLSPAPFLAYVLRLRAQIMDLQNIVWGVALGAPPASLATELVTA